jgi:hypothetical protein
VLATAGTSPATIVARTDALMGAARRWVVLLSRSAVAA